jgi:hypothetical protein
VLRGPCVLVANRFDSPPAVPSHTQARLPRWIRAETDAEVRTVVQLRWTEEPVPDVKGAKVDVCRVRPIDRVTGQLLGETTFRGEWRQVTRRPKGKAEYKEWVGYLDDGVILNWLLSLRHEP